MPARRRGKPRVLSAPPPQTPGFSRNTLPGNGVFAFPAGPEQLVEIIDGTGQAGFQLGLRTPTKHPLGFADVGAALHRIVDGQGPTSDLRARSSHLDDHFGKFSDRGLDWVTKV